MRVSNPKVGFVSLGCPKAGSDAERILTQLRAEGYEISGTYEEADLVLSLIHIFFEKHPFHAGWCIGIAR